MMICINVLQKKTEAVDLLLGNNCLVGKDENEFTPLHSACIYGREKTVEILLKHAVDINGKGKNGITPLYLACHNGDVETVQLLLSNRANVNERTDDNRTPLHEACHRGNVACLKTLLESNANIEAVDLQGNTGLMIAILSNSVGCVSLLIENKADVFIKNNIGSFILFLISILFTFHPFSSISLTKSNHFPVLVQPHHPSMILNL